MIEVLTGRTSKEGKERHPEKGGVPMGTVYYIVTKCLVVKKKKKLFLFSFFLFPFCLRHPRSLIEVHSLQLSFRLTKLGRTCPLLSIKFRF